MQLHCAIRSRIVAPVSLLIGHRLAPDERFGGAAGYRIACRKVHPSRRATWVHVPLALRPSQSGSQGRCC